MKRSDTSKKLSPEAIMQRAIARWEGEGGALLQRESPVESLDRSETRLLHRLGEAVAAEWPSLPVEARHILAARVAGADTLRGSSQLKADLARLSGSNSALDDQAGTPSTAAKDEQLRTQDV